ncbi:MAG: ABC transporter permease [Eubacteriales bacterium]
MKNIGTLVKMTWRSIRTSLGRFAALFLIVVLSVGFFAGLMLSRTDMLKTFDEYAKDQQMYDYCLISTLGFDEADEEAFSELDGVACAEGSKSVDAHLTLSGNSQPYELLSLPSQVNLPTLKEGRLPQNESECVGDYDAFTSDDIGKTITLSDENSDEVTDALNGSCYTLVGLVETPVYLGNDRGTSTTSGKSQKGFLFLLPECFTSDVYTKVYLRLTDEEAVYSDEYDELIDRYRSAVEDCCEERAQKRYEDLLAGFGLTPELAESFGWSEPSVYVLTRSENSGYVGFRNNTSIVSSIANVFPVFFIVVAMLVCITTMSRMVSEERTQIGMLKAMGFTDKAIAGKYLLYVGSATVLGWAVGYYLGTRVLPQIIWLAYGGMYNFAPLSYCFDPLILFGTLTVALAGTLCSTLYSCRRSLTDMPARLIRPKSPKAGRRTVFERIRFFWNRLSFLQKVSTRNMFRSKKKLVMMLVGVGGCSALLVTGFGVRDSLMPTGEIQYEQIQKFDLTAELTDTDSESETVLDGVEGIRDYLLHSEERVDVLSPDGLQSVTLLGFDSEDIGDYLALTDGKQSLSLPKTGEVLLSRQAADRLGLSVGDSVSLRSADSVSCTVTLSGIFDQYIDNYAIVSAETYEQEFGSWEPTTAWILSDKDCDDLAEILTETDGVSSAVLQSDKRESVDGFLDCMNYIVFLIIGFAGALDFVVIYNLTNINLEERIREIATVKVLGFYPKETGAYLLRENLILSAIAGLIGLPAGVLFHRFVMSVIDVDGMVFPIRINWISYLLSFALTMLFAFLVNLFMKRKVEGVPMAESLKTVE